MQPTLHPAKAAAASERILLVDVLRAFALFGIIINHITMSYLAGPSPAGNEQFNIFSPLDGALNTGSFMLTFGKFFTIFSFLFWFKLRHSAKQCGKERRLFYSTISMAAGYSFCYRLCS